MLAACAPALAKFCGVHVATMPAGARVHVDGRRVGTSPYVYIHGKEARVRIRLVKKGYRTWERDVDIPLDRIEGLTVELVPLRPRRPRHEIGSASDSE